MDQQPKVESGQGELRLENEFASVLLRVEPFGNGARLVVVDVKTDARLALDPLQVESIIWVGEKSLSNFVDPVFRWSEKTSARLGKGIDADSVS